MKRKHELRSKHWGKDFQFLRVNNRLTQKEAGHSAGRSQSFVSRFKNGRDIRLSELELLYQGLGLKARIQAERWHGDPAAAKDGP